MSGCGLLGWALRLGALAVMLVVAAPASAHEHSAATTAMAGHAGPCHHQDGGPAKPHEHNGCCCVSASCTSLLPPALPVMTAVPTLSAFGPPVSQAAPTLAGVPPPSKPPRT